MGLGLIWWNVRFDNINNGGAALAGDVEINIDLVLAEITGSGVLVAIDSPN